MDSNQLAKRLERGETAGRLARGKSLASLSP